MAVLVDFFVQEETKNAVLMGSNSVLMLLLHHQDIAGFARNMEATMGGRGKKGCVHGERLRSHVYLLCHRQIGPDFSDNSSVPPDAVTQ